MQKTVMYSFLTIGGIIGGYLPVLFGADGFSVWTIVGSVIGGGIGIWAAVKLSNNM